MKNLDNLIPEFHWKKLDLSMSLMNQCSSA